MMENKTKIDLKNKSIFITGVGRRTDSEIGGDSSCGDYRF